MSSQWPPQPLIRLMHRSFGLMRPRQARNVELPPGEATVESLRGKRHCAVSTFKRDGTPVVTPVWCGLEDSLLYFRAEGISGKAKRLRRDNRVLVAPCTKRGRPVGAAYSGIARTLTGADALHAESVIQANFGLGRRLYERWLTRPDGLYVEVVPS
jgi:uncharacterized protein